MKVVPSEAADLIRQTLRVPLTDAELLEVYETTLAVVEDWDDARRDDIVKAINRAGDVLLGG